MQNTDILILDVHDKDKFIIIYGNLYICKFSDFARRKILHDAKNSLFYFGGKWGFLIQ